MDLVSLNYDQVKRTKTALAPPLLTSTKKRGRLRPSTRPTSAFQCSKESRGSRTREHDRQVANLVAKNDAKLALSPKFYQVPIEPPL
ncbi:hypothetical protein TNCV_4249431 [Trichonephila clavipes]|nr:hypothetical protein TNCV_4249431 [Trichonephila clavipes]